MLYCISYNTNVLFLCPADGSGESSGTWKPTVVDARTLAQNNDDEGEEDLYVVGWDEGASWREYEDKQDMNDMTEELDQSGNI